MTWFSLLKVNFSTSSTLVVATETYSGSIINLKQAINSLPERALLRFAVYELKYTDMGKEIVVNEAVELAKKYGEEKSGEFINGVLALIIKNITA